MALLVNVCELPQWVTIVTGIPGLIGNAREYSVDSYRILDNQKQI